MDWAKYSFRGIQCKITPRETYDGRELKPGALALCGKTLRLTPMWLMKATDPYPGEWALGDYYDSRVLLDAGIAWIASGDVTPIEAVSDAN